MTMHRLTFAALVGVTVALIAAGTAAAFISNEHGADQNRGRYQTKLSEAENLVP